MNRVTFKYKIFTIEPLKSPIFVVHDWQSDEYQNFSVTDDVEECLKQPYKIAAVPVFFNKKESFTFNEQLSKIDWSQFDLVLFSDIEFHWHSYILESFIKDIGVNNYLLAVGGLEKPIQDLNCIYRPWWFFYHMDCNKNFDIQDTEKQFYFDALLGAKKPHRSYVMARFQKNATLLDKSIVTYRDIFSGPEHMSPVNDEVLKILDTPLMYPYVSPNLNPEWEVAENLNNSISSITPWTIYNKTWYSICCETFCDNLNLVNNPLNKIDNPGPYFVTEKTAKMFLAKRFFIMFGPMKTLEFLKNLGFQTFSSIIDESYDNCDNPIERFSRAFDQVEYLASLNPKEVMEKTKSIREHNFNHLFFLRSQLKLKMHKMVLDKIPDQHKEYC